MYSRSSVSLPSFLLKTQSMEPGCGTSNCEIRGGSICSGKVWALSSGIRSSSGISLPLSAAGNGMVIPRHLACLRLGLA